MQDFVSPLLPYLKYGIREVVDTAAKIKELDPSYEFVWENIGDPVAKGWPVPQFLKDLISQEIAKPGDSVFGYAHSRGNLAARQWVAEQAQHLAPSAKLTPDDVLFTSGLGSVIAMLYQMLKPGSRVLQPAPAYPTHSSFESFAAGAPPLAYRLDPEHEWQPDLEHLETMLDKHPEVVGVLIINPNNPTGAVYSLEILERIVALVEKRGLFIISDEVYFRMVFNGHKHVHVSELAANRVPLMVLRGLSKDMPWPGGRSGWVEFHNTELYPAFQAYAAAVQQRVLLEVCSTTLPQTILPQLYDHPDFLAWSKHYNAGLKEAADEIFDLLSSVPELLINRTNGAFYMMPLFREGVLNARQTLPIANARVREFIEEVVSRPYFPLDKRFTYYLLAATGIVIVPASDFYSPYPGFRLTTLDRDPVRRRATYTKLVQAIREYLESSA